MFLPFDGGNTNTLKSMLEIHNLVSLNASTNHTLLLALYAEGDVLIFCEDPQVGLILPAWYSYNCNKVGSRELVAAMITRGEIMK